MRTIGELEKWADDATICSFAAYHVDLHGNIGKELRHLIAIAREAESHICDPYGDVTCTLLDDAVQEARKAGMFGHVPEIKTKDN